jgi:hypothetical protein
VDVIEAKGRQRAKGEGQKTKDKIIRKFENLKKFRT